MAKILVIEDTSEIRNNVLDFLEAEDFEVKTAKNGREGLELALQEPFDLILCDIMMPELDGYGVISQLRQQPTTADVPFIFLTAKGERSDLRLGMTLGADDYLTKPFTPKELLAAIQTRLQRAAQQSERLRQVSVQLQQMEHLDALTGLPNQLALAGEQGLWKQAMTKVQRRQLLPFFLLGLDRFGRVNEAVGYSNGNDVLKKLAQRCQSFAQQVEALSVMRMAGDEFALILPPVERPEQAIALAQDLATAIAQPIDLPGTPLRLTASIGITFYPNASHLEAILQTARSALNTAKRQGGNGCVVYEDPIFANNSAQSLRLENDFYQAWQQQQLQVSFHPRMDAKTNKLVAIAATPAWKHPRQGNISPGTIQSLAMGAGLGLELNQWLLKTACQSFPSLQKISNSLRVSIPVSEALFSSAQLEKTLTEIQQMKEISASNISLEISADLLAQVSNLNGMAAQLMAWQRQGISVCLSDFGLAHATLDYLGQLPLNSLKLNPTLLLHPEQNLPILNTLVDLGHRLKLKVIADGVGTEGQYQSCKKQRFDEVQHLEAFSQQQIARQGSHWFGSKPSFKLF